MFKTFIAIDFGLFFHLFWYWVHYQNVLINEVTGYHACITQNSKKENYYANIWSFVSPFVVVVVVRNILFELPLQLSVCECANFHFQQSQFQLNHSLSTHTIFSSYLTFMEIELIY